ncbi:hypothetical protein LACWKB8_1490 [Lactobacillus sp. wkB8]|nr:hypothetical protein LACWKB8_1490 [Lactobacillus sp. wkB8]
MKIARGILVFNSSLSDIAFRPFIFTMILLNFNLILNAIKFYQKVILLN